MSAILERHISGYFKVYRAEKAVRILLLSRCLMVNSGGVRGVFSRIISNKYTLRESHLNVHENNHGKLQAIEAARGIAALLVVFFHAARHVKIDTGYLPLGGVFNFGHAGVDFFFVLSGFIIFFVHYQDIGRPQQFYRYISRRLTRVYPIYWAILGVTLIIAALSLKQTVPEFGGIVSNILLLPTNEGPVVGVAWTLHHEIIFYLIFSVAILHARVGVAILLSWLVLILTRVLGDVPDFNFALLSTLTSSYNIQFFMGIAAALYLIRWKLPIPRILLIMGGGVFLAFGVAENLGFVNGYTALARFAYGAAAMLVIVGLAESERQGLLVMPRALMVLGSASYSIYLVHLIAIGIADKTMQFTMVRSLLPVWAIYLILCASGAVGGILVSRWIEHPSIRLCRNLLASAKSRGWSAATNVKASRP